MYLFYILPVVGQIADGCSGLFGNDHTLCFLNIHLRSLFFTFHCCCVEEGLQFLFIIRYQDSVIGEVKVVEVASAYLYALVFPDVSKDNLNLRLKRSGEMTQPCLTPLLIGLYSLCSLSILIAADCSQYKFLKMQRSFASTSNLDRMSNRSLCLTLSNAFE